MLTAQTKFKPVAQQTKLSVIPSVVQLKSNFTSGALHQTSNFGQLSYRTNLNCDENKINHPFPPCSPSGYFIHHHFKVKSAVRKYLHNMTRHSAP
jgi:hypothetical protein